MLVLKKNDLIQRIESKNAMVGIVGLGYVELPLLLRCCEAGYNVIGFDISEEKVTALSKGKSYIEHIQFWGNVQGEKNPAICQQLDARAFFQASLQAAMVVPYSLMILIWQQQ